jgi:hypothetical protein
MLSNTIQQLADSEFTSLPAAQQKERLRLIFGGGDGRDVAAELNAAFASVMDAERTKRREQQRLHQKRMALAFVRKIHALGAELGDPIIIVGDAGGNGGRGRAQLKHQLLLDTLAGFFVVIIINETCTTRTATCCHQRAHAPAKGRSRGCKRCDNHRPDPPGPGKPKPDKTSWWDRDQGAAW